MRNEPRILTRGDECPLRQLLLVEIIIEGSEVLQQAKSGIVGSERLKSDQGAVLAHVVIVISLLVGIVETLETSVRHMLLVLSVRDALEVKDISDCRDVGGNLSEVVFSESISVA